MRRFSNLSVLLAILFGAMSPQTVQAVIVAGISGTGNNNGTKAGLDSYLSTTAYAAFPYWNNMVRVSDASGVYLGYNPSTMRGWVMSANHVTSPTSIAVGGNTYSVTGSTRIGTSDIKLYRIGGGVSDPALPTLPTVPLTDVFATTGEFLLMLGRGFTTSTSAPYPWGTPGFDDANGMRWATNTVEGGTYVNVGSVAVPNVQPYLFTDFDGPAGAGATAYDGQASLGDSGGGIFIHRGGQWFLSGIAHFVDDGPDFVEAVPTGDGTVNPAQFGDFSAYTDVRTYAGTIAGVTGTLVPEPSTASLLLLGLMAWKRRRD